MTHNLIMDELNPDEALIDKDESLGLWTQRATVYWVWLMEEYEHMSHMGGGHYWSWIHSGHGLTATDLISHHLPHPVFNEYMEIIIYQDFHWLSVRRVVLQTDCYHQL